MKFLKFIPFLGGSSSPEPRDARPRQSSGQHEPGREAHPESNSPLFLIQSGGLFSEGVSLAGCVRKREGQCSRDLGSSRWKRRWYQWGQAVGMGPQVSKNPVYWVTVPVAQAGSPHHGHRVWDPVGSRISTVWQLMTQTSVPWAEPVRMRLPSPHHTASLAKWVHQELPFSRHRRVLYTLYLIKCTPHPTPGL